MENNSTFTFNSILHSVQVYWGNNALALNAVLTQLISTNQIDETMINNIKNAITTAEQCANLYGDVIRVPLAERDTNKIAETNYNNAEIVFYNQLIGLLLNDEVRNLLQSIVYEDVVIGTRYFTRFLTEIGVDYN